MEVVDLMVHPQASIVGLIYIQPSNDLENPKMILQVTMFLLVLGEGRNVLIHIRTSKTLTHSTLLPRMTLKYCAPHKT